MRCYELKNWEYDIDFYGKEAKLCNDNGSGYFAEVTAALEQNIAPELITEIRALCKNKSAGTSGRGREIINTLRRVFTQISLDKPAPDLVIMNEYQIGNVPVDYVKSVPYLLSFMEDYKIKENITKQYAANPDPGLLKRYRLCYSGKAT